MTFPAFFREEQTDSTGRGPDFPGSAGDRERGRFRPSRTPRLTSVAVVGDDGRPVVSSTDALLAEVVLWQKATVLAMMWSADGESFTLNDLLSEARSM